MTDDDAAGMTAAMAAGLATGATSRLVMADEATGMSLTYAAFKAGFLLPRHSHDAHCAYYVIAGEAHLGNAVLKAGDAFVVPAGHFYSYRAGPAGVEVMEFRTRTEFHFKFGGNTPSFWQEVIAATKANADAWRNQPPSEAARRLLAGQADRDGTQPEVSPEAV
ncbi:cupin domain-containing protein [uncultured Sphingomonas sp.]|uniref:cupin domain-containing protein n=1 Tax=uncultured Sphingomonas sp. TaxID=158754 RepID=UPI0035C958EF